MACEEQRLALGLKPRGKKACWPEKNPDEYLNCDLKYGMSERPAPKNKEQLKNNIESHMKMQEAPKRVKSILGIMILNMQQENTCD